MDELGGALISFDGGSQYSSKQPKKEHYYVSLSRQCFWFQALSREIFLGKAIYLFFSNTIFVAKAAQNQVKLCRQLDSVRSSVDIFASHVV